MVCDHVSCALRGYGPPPPHDRGRGRGGVAAALARIGARTTVVGITTDIVFTPAEMRELHGMIAGSTYHEMTPRSGTTASWSNTGS